jgi:rubrerythrin
MTASAIMSFAEKLEDQSSKFYNNLTERFVEHRELFLSFAKESEKNKVLVIRTYQETINDALEACFSFSGLNLNDYLIDTTLAENIECAVALKVALELEKKAVKFYLDVANRSESLLATIPRALRKAAEVRNKRMQKIKSLLVSK